MLDLTTLRTVLEPLAQVGKDEHTFEVGAHRVTLRPLLPHEEVSVQRYASSFLEEREKEKGPNSDEEAGMDRAEALDYFDRFRIEVIAHAICEIDGHSIRDSYVLTGETTEQGVAVKVPRGQAMRELIRNSWSRTMITSTFAQYGELVERLSLEADKIAGRSVADLDVEIERVSDRLKQLRRDRLEKTKGDPSISNEEMQSLVEADKASQQGTKEVVQRAKTIREERIRAESKAQEAFGTQPAKTAPVQKPKAPAQEPPVQPAPTSNPTPPTTHTSFEDIQSSFQDGDDPEVVAAEQSRILEARRRAQQKQREQLQQDAAKGLTQPTGEVGGVEAYRLPPTELSPRGRSAPAQDSIALDGKPRGEKNPNFKGK